MLATIQIPPIDPAAPLWGLYDANYGITANVASLSFPNDLDNAAWTKNNCTISANATTDPMGGTTADKIVEDNLNAIHYIAQNSVGGVAGTLRTWSCYAKAAGRDWCYLGDNTNGVNFNLTTGAIGFISGSVVAKSITPASNGWYFLTVTTVSAGIQVNLAPLNGDGVAVPYVGDGVSGIYAWNILIDMKMVSQWTDQSLNPATGALNGHNLLQATAALQPVLVQGWNGKLCLRLDGADDFLKTAGATLNQPTTVMLAHNIQTLTAAGVHDIAYDGVNLGSMNSAVYNLPQMNINAGAPSLNYNAAPGNNSGVVMTGEYNGASSSIAINGQIVASGATGASNGGGFTLGALSDGTRSIASDFFRVCVFSGVMSPYLRALWERWMMAAFHPTRIAP